MVVRRLLKIWILASALLGAVASAGARESLEKTLVNVDRSDTAVHGYDLVAYFTYRRPVKGVSQFTSTHRGVRYRFSSAQHKAAFDAEPAVFLPLFGGYCVLGVVGNRLMETQPDAFRFVDGRLVFLSDKAAAQRFDKDPVAALAKAEENWPALLQKKGK